MTRETKVGLVVASSFLCLVGVVVASRMGRIAKAQGEGTIAQTISPNEHNLQGKKEPDKKEPTPLFPEAKKNAPTVLPAEFTAPAAPPGKPIQPTPPVDKLKSGDLLFPAPPVQPPPVQPPPVAESKNPFGPEPAAQEQEKKLKALKEIKNASELAGKPDSGLPPAPPVGGLDLFPPAVVANAVTKDKKAGPPPLAEVKAPESGPPADPFAAPKGPPNPPAFGPAPQAPPVAAVKPPQAGDNAKLTLPPPPGTPPPDAFGSFPKPPDPVGNPPAPKQDLVFPPPPSATVDAKPKSPDAVPAFGNPAPAQGPLAFNKELTNPTLPPLGAEAKNAPPVMVPPVTVKPPSGTLPQVKSFDVDTYFCKPEDTSFDAVSTRYYSSPRYAKALQQFNREHPLAKDNIKLQDNPRLQPNQAVFVPPKEILEARYASLVDNRPAFAPAPSAPPISISPPLNSTPALGAPGIPTAGRMPVPSAPSNDVTKPYRVPAQGQMVWEIAQQTLGDPRRWSEIYRLNNSLRPEAPIPGGTEIRLPASANVP